MEKTWISLADHGRLDELAEQLDKVAPQEISSLVQQKATRGKCDPVPLVRALLQGSPASNTEGVQRRLVVFKQCISLLQRGDLESKVAAELGGLLMFETDAFPGRYLAELASIYVDAIKSDAVNGARSLDLFPKILSALEMQETVSYGGKELKGPEYKSHVLNNLCSARWDPKNVIDIATMFKDVAMTSDELRFLIAKILRMLHETEAQEWPPIVYQLLGLSTKGHKRLVLEGVVAFFSDRDKVAKQEEDSEELSELSQNQESGDQLHQSEGTVILHVTYAVKHDPELGREFIKYLKANLQHPSAKVLSPFVVALALSIGRIHRFEEQIFELLKGAVLKSYKDKEKQEQSAWVREMAPENTDITPSLMDTVKNSVNGWEHVPQGLMQLGFTLMDSYGPKAAFGRMEQPTVSVPQTPQQRACKLGADLLHATFKAHEMVRQEMLHQMLNRVVIQTSNPVTHFLDLLSLIVQTAPQTLLDSITRVREALDYLALLPISTAGGLLKSLIPMLKLSIALKDFLLLVLRKAMFSRQVDSRKIAVNGFLLILKYFKILGGLGSSQASQSFSLSQIQVDIHVNSTPGSNEALCLEIVGNLQRCLSQQADVRMELYEGLYDVTRRNGQLASPILGLLHKQLEEYYEEDEAASPALHLDRCIMGQEDQVFLQEPLGHLLGALAHCLVRTSPASANQDEDEEEDEETVEFQLRKLVNTLTGRIINSQLEDFELDKSADFSTANSVGVRNNIFAILLLNTYEVLMEYKFMTSHLEPHPLQEVQQLFDKYQTLMVVLRDKPAAGKKGKQPPGGAKSLPKSLLSIRCISELLDALFLNAESGARMAHFRENRDFMHYVAGIMCQKVQQIQSGGQCDGPDGSRIEKVFAFLCSVARVTYEQYTGHIQNPEGHQDRSKQLHSQYLEVFTTCISVVCTQYADKLGEFLTSLGGEKQDGAMVTDELLHKHIKALQRLVMNLLSGDDDLDLPQKDAVPLVAAIHTMTKLMAHTGTQFEQVLMWLHKLCTDKPLDDTAVTKALLSNLLQLTTLSKNCGGLLKELAQDIHSHLGDIDQEVEIEDKSNFAIVTQTVAAPHLVLLLMSHVDQELDDTDWVINKLRADLMLTAQASEDMAVPAPTQRENTERSTCGRLGVLANAFIEIVQSAVPVGPTVDAVLKVLVKLYTVLSSLVKFYISMYTLKVGQLSSRFEKLVRLSGSSLTPNIYCMITYIQNASGEHLQQQMDKPKKKGAGKQKGNAVQSGTARVLKEAKMIPNLIFCIEQYEKFLIQLSKKAKVNLMEHVKRSTARDFRINQNALQAAIEQQDDSPVETVSSDDEAGDPPPTKKQKTSPQVPGTSKGQGRAEEPMEDGAGSDSE